MSEINDLIRKEIDAAISALAPRWPVAGRAEVESVEGDQAYLKGLGGTYTVEPQLAASVGDLVTYYRLGEDKRVTNVVSQNAVAARADLILGKLIAGQIDVDELSAISANLGTVIAGLLRDAGDNVRFDLDSSTLEVYDTQDPPQLRLRLGKIGEDSTSYGLQVYDDSGDIAFTTEFGLGGYTDSIEFGQAFGYYLALTYPNAVFYFDPSAGGGDHALGSFSAMYLNPDDNGGVGGPAFQVDNGVAKLMGDRLSTDFPYGINAAELLAGLLTTQGDIAYRGSGSVAVALGIGSEGKLFWSDGSVPRWVSVKNALGIERGGAIVAANSTSYVTLAEKTGLTIAAGDVISFEALLNILNDSGGNRVYTLAIDLGGTALEIDLASLGPHATNKFPLWLRGAIWVNATNDVRWMMHYTPDPSPGSNSIAADAKGTGTTAGYKWNATTGDLTGSNKTAKLKVKSASATATQTVTVLTARIWGGN